LIVAISPPPSKDRPPHKPSPGLGEGLVKLLHPKITDLQILNTTLNSLTIGARLNFTNPTTYSASIPYLDVHILVNDTLLAHGTVRGVEILEGRNEWVWVQGVYDPVGLNPRNDTADGYADDGEVTGPEGVGREFLSQYISGYNTSLTIRLHEGSFPGLPKLGRALGRFNVTVPTPRLRTPGPGSGDGDDHDDPEDPDPGNGDGGGEEDRPHFIQDATFHLLTSTADFVLLSPLTHTTLTILDISATALYPNDKTGLEEPVGRIEYDLPFEVPPPNPETGEGVKTPRLPVDWSLGSVGYEAVKKALGGELRLGAYAEVGVQVGKWQPRGGVWFRGRGIGARVRV
jgi:hypothetical protein